MGIAVVGGLILATGLTLYVVPAVYSYVSKEGKTVSNVADALGRTADQQTAVPGRSLRSQGTREAGGRTPRLISSRLSV